VEKSMKNNDYSKDMYDLLSPEQGNAVDTYTVESQEMNPPLREGEEPEEYRELYKNLDSAIEQQEAKEHDVYRGIGDMEFKSPHLEKGYLSTSPNKETAQMYASGWGGNRVLHIHAKNHKAFYLPEHGDDDEEVLFGRNHKLHELSRKNEDGYEIIEVELE
jgi:hypothetical protein